MSGCRCSMLMSLGSVKKKDYSFDSVTKKYVCLRCKGFISKKSYKLLK